MSTQPLGPEATGGSDDLGGRSDAHVGGLEASSPTPTGPVARRASITVLPQEAPEHPDLSNLSPGGWPPAVRLPPARSVAYLNHPRPVVLGHDPVAIKKIRAGEAHRCKVIECDAVNPTETAHCAQCTGASRPTTWP